MGIQKPFHTHTQTQKKEKTTDLTKSLQTTCSKMCYGLISFQKLHNFVRYVWDKKGTSPNEHHIQGKGIIMLRGTFPQLAQ